MFSDITPGFSLGKMCHLISNGVEMVPSKPREEKMTPPGRVCKPWDCGWETVFAPTMSISSVDGKVSAREVRGVVATVTR